MQTPKRAIPVATAVLLVLVVSGCPHDYVAGDSAPADPDGVPCSESQGASEVWIDVNYSGNSVSTTSDTCTVDQGTQITWRGPVASREGFGLEFDTASPAGSGSARRSMISSGNPLVFNSSYIDGRQKILITANNDSGTYEYDIFTDNGGVDPVIIIRN